MIKINFPQEAEAICQIQLTRIKNQTERADPAQAREEVMKGNRKILCNNNSHNSLIRIKEECPKGSLVSLEKKKTINFLN